jgi:hypothetical protein
MGHALASGDSHSLIGRRLLGERCFGVVRVSQGVERRLHPLAPRHLDAFGERCAVSELVCDVLNHRDERLLDGGFLSK